MKEEHRNEQIEGLIEDFEFCPRNEQIESLIEDFYMSDIMWMYNGAATSSTDCQIRDDAHKKLTVLVPDKEELRKLMTDYRTRKEINCVTMRGVPTYLFKDMEAFEHALRAFKGNVTALTASIQEVVVPDDGWERTTLEFAKKYQYPDTHVNFRETLNTEIAEIESFVGSNKARRFQINVFRKYDRAYLFRFELTDYDSSREERKFTKCELQLPWFLK